MIVAEPSLREYSAPSQGAVDDFGGPDVRSRAAGQVRVVQHVAQVIGEGRRVVGGVGAGAGIADDDGVGELLADGRQVGPVADLLMVSFGSSSVSGAHGTDWSSHFGVGGLGSVPVPEKAMLRRCRLHRPCSTTE